MDDIPYWRFYSSLDDRAVFDTVDATISEHRFGPDNGGPEGSVCTCGWEKDPYLGHVTHEIIQALRKAGFSIVRN